MSGRVRLRGAPRAGGHSAGSTPATRTRDPRVRLGTRRSAPAASADAAEGVVVTAGRRRRVGSMCAMACAVVLAVAALLPWVRIDTVVASATGRGIDGDGVLTFVLALVAVGVVVADLRRPHWLLAATCASSFGTALVIGTYDLTRIASLVDVSGMEGEVERGIGLWLTVAASLVGVLAAAMLAADPARPVTAPGAAR
ncbi:MAG: hypothetical protein S0880_07280 [Actinomycetota bacterium]|nr:hypothetical protein [Actinomycetota bacterium]